MGQRQPQPPDPGDPFTRMTEDQIEDVATKATWAALAVIDKATDNKGKKSEGPLGNSLAFGIHDLIEKALIRFNGCTCGIADTTCPVHAKKTTSVRG